VHLSALACSRQRNQQARPLHRQSDMERQLHLCPSSKTALAARSIGVHASTLRYGAPAFPSCTKTRAGVALLPTGRREEGAPCTIGLAAPEPGGTRFCNDQKKMMIMPTVRAMINAASSMPIERELI
jgi:hypothetical protein